MKKRSWKHQLLTEKTLLATVDIGKNQNFGYYRCRDGRDVPTFRFSNCGEGFKKFYHRLLEALKQFGLTEVVVGFESTGPYAEPLMHFLHKRGVRLVQVSPAHVKRVKELTDNSPNKTDEKDPTVIANLIELGAALTVVIPEGAAAELRRLSQARERMLANRNALHNQLHDLIFVTFPEFLRVFPKLTRKSARTLIAEYPTPAQLLKLSLEDLTERLRRLSRGRWQSAHAEAIYRAAQESVGVVEGQQSLVFEIQHLIRQFEACEKFIAEVETEMNLQLTHIPYSRFLRSLRGLGTVTLAGLIGEVGDFNHFKTEGELLKYAGLNLFEISSGEHKGRRRISKRGRPLLRKLLFLATLNMVRAGGIMHACYQRYVDGGMIKLKALVAICRKLLGLMLALVRKQCEYIANYQSSFQVQ